MSARGYGLTVLAGTAGGAAAVFCASQPWARVTVETQGLARDVVSVSGNDAVGIVGGTGLVVAAGSVAVLASSGWVRRAVGAVVALAAVVGLVAVLSAPGGVHDALARALADSPAMAGDAAMQERLADAATATWWRWGAAAGLTVGAVAGLATVWLGAAWPSMGRRYDSIGQQRADADDDPWKALDRGEDPTV
ncbi:putative membrane protein (TIGR02234 family) [Mumia flava]|uniref:Putative membrane protein (TIGR02234 family) n=1 Tax=Mumia flava TaxID=1348852 RepID=A0A0B2BUS7_9ACTN|nr:Trp biosynthesis-associated membrane protein [Mumia flava]PJJ55994.1 putative membrane protein (TIGR02234 family) [Mumia flava]